MPPVPSAAQARRQRQQQTQAYRRAARQLEQRRHAREKFPSTTPPGPGRLRIVSDEPPIVVTVLLAEALDVDGAVGGWEEIARDGASPGIQHVGIPRGTCGITCVLDRDVLGIDDLEIRLSRLYSMGRVSEVTQEPARIQLVGDTPAHNPLWVMDGLKVNKTLRDAVTGSIRQAWLTISLSEWIDTSLAVTLPNQSTRTSGGKKRAEFYFTRDGDTLRRVALTRLGSQAYWKDLLAANRKLLRGVDPDQPLRRGIRLKLDRS